MFLKKVKGIYLFTLYKKSYRIICYEHCTSPFAKFSSDLKLLLISREFKTMFETFLSGMIANNTGQNEQN